MPPRTRKPGEKRPLSDKQRAQLERLHAQHDRHTAENLEPAVNPLDDTEEYAGPTGSADDGGAAILQQMANIFQDAAGKKTAQIGVLREVEGLLGKLTPEDYPSLAKSPQIQAFIELLGTHAAELHPDALPGSIQNPGSLAVNKRPWEWRHMKDFEMKTFTPNETILIVWQGLPLQLVADEEMTVPKPFYDTYMERKSATLTAREHADILYRRKDVMDLRERAGGVRADPSVMNDGTSKVRAQGQGRDGYKPGAGMFNPADEPGREGIEEEAVVA